MFVVNIIYNYYMMTVLYTHYTIDYTTSLAVSWIGIRVAEKYASYYPDVKGFGLRKEMRPQRFW